MKKDIISQILDQLLKDESRPAKKKKYPEIQLAVTFHGDVIINLKCDSLIKKS